MDNSRENLKQELISLSMATDMGFKCTREQAEQIEKLAKSLEQLNPTPEPTKKMELVSGRWQLLYSTFGLEQETTLSRLSFGKLPNVAINVTGIFQEIETIGQQYNNLIEFTVGSAVKGITAVTGRYTVVDSKRLDIAFLETSARSGTKDLNDAAFREALGIKDESILKAELSFNGWSDITYLDNSLRLMRGNQENLYVLLRFESIPL